MAAIVGAATRHRTVEVGGDIPHLAEWERILRSWHDVIDEYIRQVTARLGYSDVPWWFNERANVGILAGAIWRAGPGHVCLEEYSVERGTGDDRGPGRCDLWLQTPSTSWDLEAKAMWPNTADGWNDDVLSSRLDVAKEQLKSIPRGDRADCGIAACFVLPKFVRRDDDEGYRDDALRVLDRLRSIASSRRRGPRVILGAYILDDDEAVALAAHDGSVYPGVIFVGRQVRGYGSGE